VVVVIPTPVVEGLIQALQTQRDKQAGSGKPSAGTIIQ
jgi:hypothetical protein